MNSLQARLAFGKKVRAAREDKGLTQSEVAGKAGLNTNYYACIERGEVNPSLEKIQNIVKALGLKSFDVMSL